MAPRDHGLVVIIVLATWWDSIDGSLFQLFFRFLWF
jgi:hypothetical protein